MPLKTRFVILEHNHPLLHWDFMLESGAALRTWRMLELPEAGRRIVAERLPDHRLTYLDYEGPVSRGRGEVRRWDRGEYATLAETPAGIDVRLNGEKLRGVASIAREGARDVFYFVPERSGSD